MLERQTVTETRKKEKKPSKKDEHSDYDQLELNWHKV